MDRDNQQIPGFGFDPGYEPGPAPSPSVPTSTSLFGLISKVNKGILKQPLPASTTPPDPASLSIQQARAVAQKLSNIDPNIAKQRAFQNAKSVIDNIQRGIWTPQTTDQKQQQQHQQQKVPQQPQQPVNTGFKVPVGAPRPKPVTETQVYKPENRPLNVPGNQPQSKNTLPLNVQGNLPQIKNPLALQPQNIGTPGMQQPAVNQAPRSIVPYNEDNDITGERNYSRQKALEEIDRYRGSVRKEMKDSSFEEKRAKKNDSFKSDFDRYYYGSDTQRSEIVDKLHRSSTFNKTETDAKLHRSNTNDYNEKYQDPVNKPQNYEVKTDYGTRRDMDTYTSSQYKPMDAVKSRDEYEDYKYSKEYGTGERTTERKQHDDYRPQTDRYVDRKQGDSVEMERPKLSPSYSSDLNTPRERERDYEPPQRRAEPQQRRAEPPQRRDDPPQRRAEHESQRSHEKTTYTGNYDTYQQDSKNRNVRHNSDGSDSQKTDSPNVFDYGHATKSFKYEDRLSEDRYTDNRQYDDERRNRESDDHYDDRYYRDNRYSEEREYYRDSRDRYQDRYNDQRYDDDGYDMGDRYRDEREMNYREEDYGRDMQEMEDFPEVAEANMDKKSQDGEMLYEEYLFGIEDEELEEGMASPVERGSHRGDGTSGRSERYPDSRDRRDRYTRSDHRDKYSDTAAAADRRVDDRNLPITDDQKVLEKPTPQPVPPPVVSVVAQPVTSGVPMMLPATTQILTPVSGIFCKDCNVMCIDQEIFDSHLKSDIHILTLQRKAQELFHMQSKQSRFDLDMAGNPLRAQVLPPPVLAGIPSSALTSSGRNVFIGDTGSPCDDRDDRGDSPTRFRSRSDSRIQVIPPKPLGPLEAQSVNQTWLILQWRARHEEEEELIDKYVVEYRNAREIRWVRVGATIKHEYEVNGLQEGTDYLFRVYTMNRKERSEYLESVLITTKKKKDSPERGRRRSSRERNRRSTSRDRGHRSNSMDRGHRSSSRDRGQRSSRDRRPVQEKGMKHIRERDRRRSGDRERRSSRDRVIRDSKSSRDKPGKERQNRMEKKKSEDQKNKSTVQSSSKTGTQVEEVKDEVKPEAKGEVNDDVKPDKEEEKKEEPENEDIECLLYREFQNYENEAMLGLDHIYEIRSYMSMTPPRYVCKLCNNKGSHKIIVRHIMGFPHKLNFFKKYDAEVYEVISMIAMKKQQMERANYEARRAEDKLGRGSVRVMLQLNPHDHNGKTVYRDPIPVKAPPPGRAKEIGEAPLAIQVNYEPQFMALYNEHVEANALDDTTLIGLSYVKEILHPTMEKESKYSCGLCNVLCHDCSILSHLLGKRHRLNYLKTYYETLHDEIVNTKDGRNQLLLEKIKMIAEKDGPGTMKVKVAKNDRLWKDKTSKTAESVPEQEPDPEEQDGNQDETTVEDSGVPEESEQKTGVPAIKFGIKKSEPPSTNVKPINVLEQEQAATKTKEGFDWNKENSLLQSKIQNETIIKSSRKSKFITVYSEFFKRYPVIGMQWVTEFQKQDPKHEPWYMCFMCQQKQQWKHILDHVTSNLHRINYMKKSDYREKYNAVYNMMKTNKAGVRPLIEEFSKEISDKEGPPTELEVMIELNINTEAFKSVAKVQENVKAHATATTSSHSSIQINIATTSLSGSKTTDVTMSTTSGTPVTVSMAQTTVSSTNVVTAAQTNANLTPTPVGQLPGQYIQQPVGMVPVGLKPPPPLQPVATQPTGTPLVTASFPYVHLPPPNFQAASGQAFPNMSVPPPLFPHPNYVGQRSDSTNQMPVPNVNVNTGVNLRGPATFTQRPGQPGGQMLQVLGVLPSQRPPPMFPQTALPHQFYPQSQPLFQGQNRLPPPLPVQQQAIQQTIVQSSVQPPDGGSKLPLAPSAPVQLPGVVTLATQPTQQGPTNQFGSRPPPWQKQPPLQTEVATPGASNPFQQSGQPINDSQNLLQSKKGDEIGPLLEMNFKNQNVDSPQEDKVVSPSFRKESYLDTKTGYARGDTDMARINRGTKRHSEEKKDFESNKRFSRDESRTDLRQEGRLSSRQHNVSSRGRSSREREFQGKDDKERRRDFQRNEGRFERSRDYRDNGRGRNDRGIRRNRRSRSRSPYRMDQRKGYDRESERQNSEQARHSESRMRRRDDTRHAIRKPSPRSTELSDDRRHTKYEADFHEEDYNEPLAAAKIDDLIKQYSDRVDDDFGNIIGDQFDQVSDDGFDDDNVLYDHNAGQRIRNHDGMDHRDDREERVKYGEHFEHSRSQRFEHDEFDGQYRPFDRRNNSDTGRIRYNDRELDLRNDRYDEERRSRSVSDQLSLDRDRREMDRPDIELNREKSMSVKLRDDRREDQWSKFPSDEIQRNRLLDARDTYTGGSIESTSTNQRFTVRQADVGLERDFGRYERPDPPREEIDALLRRVSSTSSATEHSPSPGGHREYEGRTPRDWGRESRDRPMEKEGTTDRSGPMNRGGSADRGGHMDRSLSADRGRGRSSRASYRGGQRGSFRGRAQRPM